MASISRSPSSRFILTNIAQRPNRSLAVAVPILLPRCISSSATRLHLSRRNLRLLRCGAAKFQYQLSFRSYTNFRKGGDRHGGDDWFGAFFWGVLLIGMSLSLINWQALARWYPWLPFRRLFGSPEDHLILLQFEKDIYDYGYENLPLSYRVANTPMLLGEEARNDLFNHTPGVPRLYRDVEAAELPHARSSHDTGGSKLEPDIHLAGAEDDAEEKKAGGFRNRKITEYENRIRAYSTPDKVFRLFATLKIQDPDGDGFGIYMTPDDFIRAITPGMRQPEGLGLDQFKHFDPSKDRIESDIPEDSIFHKLGERGLISFSDYLFLMTVLAISARHIEIAFKIFDVNGDGTVDSEEFEEILNVLRSQTSVGLRHREGKMLGGSYAGSKFVDSGLKKFFFGNNGTGKLKVQDFLAFQAKMKDEVLKMEFDRSGPVDGKITERTFAKMLLSYAGISEQKQKRMVKRVKERFQGVASKGIDFDQLQSFSQVFRHLNDIDTALGLYHVAGGSIDHSTLQRVVKTVAKTDLDDHVVDVVFTLFDENEDGRLSQREFISIMKGRSMRGMERPKDMGVTRMLSAVWKCTKEEMQGSRH